MAELVKNPPTMWETWVQSLGWEDALEKGKPTHSSILAWRIPWTVQSMGSQSWAQLSDFHFQLYVLGFPEFSLEGLMLEAEAPMLWPPDVKNWKRP